MSNELGLLLHTLTASAYVPSLQRSIVWVWTFLSANDIRRIFSSKRKVVPLDLKPVLIITRETTMNSMYAGNNV